MTFTTTGALAITAVMALICEVRIFKTSGDVKFINSGGCYESLEVKKLKLSLNDCDGIGSMQR